MKLEIDTGLLVGATHLQANLRRRGRKITALPPVEGESRVAVQIIGVATIKVATLDDGTLELWVDENPYQYCSGCWLIPATEGQEASTTSREGELVVATSDTTFIVCAGNPDNPVIDIY